MSNMDLLNGTCTLGESETHEFDISQLHLSCMRNRVVVSDSLPTTGKEGTTYMVGNNESGYEEYIWNGNKFVRMGTAVGSLVKFMTSRDWGLGKLSTDNVLIDNESAVVGMNANNQLRVPLAKLGVPGSICLGSAIKRSNARPYIVGIGHNENKQLSFNLARWQPDAIRKGAFVPGSLQYTQFYIYDDAGNRVKDENGEDLYEWQMWIKMGSVSDCGVVKLLHSLTGYTEEQIDSMRDTHAASVGLVIDRLDSFCDSFFTEIRLQGYFNNWAKTRSLGDEIWENDTYRNTLLTTTLDNVLNSENFGIEINQAAKEFLETVATDEYFNGLFLDVVIDEAKKISDKHWDDDLESRMSEIVEEQLPGRMDDYLTQPENLADVASAVKTKVQDLIADDIKKTTLDYAKRVFNGDEQITIGETQTTFPAYINTKVTDLINTSLQASLATINANISELQRSVNSIKNKAFNVTDLGTLSSSGALPVCADYDFIQVTTNVGSTFIFSVPEIKRAHALATAWSWVDVWGYHDDDVEYSGAQIRIDTGWVFNECAAYVSAFPMTIRGLRYVN